ncbi:response regulator [Variovorax paradoxus]|uniref:response regulator n=1 Tax=Variovorax paradoxus TaxID=34073 RepID=UPI0024804ADF|nr:response regulator [Variovorax paradoxus]WGT62433.1 response regulator [Variovorax paradoxus]
MVVDDDDITRAATAEMLVALGHVVTQASSGEQALADLERHPGIHVLMVDVGLPGMSGAALAEAACRRLPGLKVVFATGQDVALLPTTLNCLLSPMTGRPSVK